jgi:putative FmdB family regulatory protein
MPIFEYECAVCNKRFEELVLPSEEEPSECKFCGSKNVKRLISGGIGIVFKGSGFYITDYGKNKKESSDKKEEKGGNSCCSGGSCSC